MIVKTDLSTKQLQIRADREYLENEIARARNALEERQSELKILQSYCKHKSIKDGVMCNDCGAML